MLNKKVTIYDTTLRDGTQAEEISLTSTDKIKIAQRLDALLQGLLDPVLEARVGVDVVPLLGHVDPLGHEKTPKTSNSFLVRNRKTRSHR